MKLHFRKIGEGHPVVLLHGLFGSSDNWQTFAKQLALSQNLVYLVDLRNHGLSPHDNNFNYEVLATDIKELFDDEQLKGATLIGHSLGGKTAMQFAFLYPHLINDLIVVDIGPGAYPVQHRKIIDTLLSVPIDKISSRKEVASILSKNIDEPPVIQFLLKNLYWRDKAHLGWRFHLHAINENIEQIGTKVKPNSSFTIPTLFVKGELSDYINYDQEREIYELFEKVELKIAPGAGHWVHADNPQWLLKEVTAFIAAHKTS